MNPTMKASVIHLSEQESNVRLKKTGFRVGLRKMVHPLMDEDFNEHNAKNCVAEKKNTILIIDSDPQFQKLMSYVLDSANFKIIECRSGKEASRLCALTRPNLVLLDLTLSDMDGKDVLAAIREKSHVPVIILTIREGNDDVIMALNMGANDYVTKPFNTEVLLARMMASLRKFAVNEAGAPEIRNGPLRMDLVRHKVFLNDELLTFTPKEYNLLRYFIVHRGKMLTHKQILKEVWGPAHGEDTQYLRVYVGQVRAKISKHPAATALITTEAGVGYRMEISEPKLLS
ncbi:MAG: response regulator transcription factor [Alphaproteobacteria bacterium]|nr:response regulator transcription factor [Alphaproteobacteria bacterium]